MDSSVLPKDEIWFLHMCHHISTGSTNLPNYITTPKTVILILAIVRNLNLIYSKEQLAGGTLYTHSYRNVFESEI